LLSTIGIDLKNNPAIYSSLESVWKDSNQANKDRISKTIYNYDGN
jgi:hypothetical protein